MRRKHTSLDNNAVGISALDIFANAVGALALLLLLFAVNAIELARPTTLSILTKRVQESRIGVEYFAVLAAIGGVPPYAWSLHSGVLPEGLHLDRTRGEIGGSVNASVAEGVYPFEAMVTDARNKTAWSRLELRVMPRKSGEEGTTEPLVLLTHGELPDAVAGKPYALYLSARGGSGRYRWSAEGLPQGLGLAGSSGLCSGTPEGAGVHELILRVWDAQAESDDLGQAIATASLRVSARDGALQSGHEQSPPRILTEALPPATESEPYEAILAGSGLEPLRWSAQNLPPGLSGDGHGLISGTPSSDTRTRVTIAMEDALDRKAAAKTIVLTVKSKPITAMSRIKEQGIWGWLCYILMILGNIVFLFILRFRATDRFDYLLRNHDVLFIKKPDGTSALSGEPNNMEAVRRQVNQINRRYRRYRIISYAILVILIAAYTLFLLR